MESNHLKKRILTAAVSVTFFVITCFSFGYFVKGDEFLLGFNVDGNGFFSFFSTSQIKAESDQSYPLGDVENQVLLVDLKSADMTEEWPSSGALSTANQVLNGESDSLKAYIKELSYNRLNVNSTIYMDDIKGFSPSKDKSYYLDTTNGTEAALEEELLLEVLAQFETQTGTIKTKTKAELDKNNDTFIDNMTFVIRGDKDNSHNLLWPHQYSLNADGKGTYFELTVADGTLKVKDYNVILSGEGTSGIFHADSTDLGVIAHEYLHVYGLPDMYHNYRADENGNFIPLPTEEQIGDPLGQWDVMDNTIANTPQYPLVYTNKMYSPWGSAVPEFGTIDTSTNGVSVKKVQYGSGTDTIAYILKVDASINKLAEDEYFVVEYRKAEGWDSGLPSSGLLVYRINTAANHKNSSDAINNYCDTSKESGKNCGNMFGAPDEVFIFRPNAESYLTGNKTGNTDRNLDQAALGNGTKTLGKTLDEVPGYNLNTFANTIYFSDGTNSGIVISNVSDAGGESITFDVSIPEVTNDETAPVVGEGTGSGLNGVWTNGTPSISVHVSDVGLGIAEINVKTEQGSIMNGSEETKTYTETYRVADKVLNTNFTFKAVKNGSYTVTAKDHNGNISEVKTIEVTNIDNVKPTISVGKVTITSTNTTIPVTFEDKDSNINLSTAFYTTVSLKDSTENLVYDQAITNNTITLAPNFQGKVCITVKDNAGNASEGEGCWVVSKDDKKPTLQVTANESPDVWVAQNIKIDIIAKDIDSDDTGIQYLEITTEDGTIDNSNARQLLKDYGIAGKNEESFSFDVLKNGTYLVKAYDYAGNISEESVTIKQIDQSAPVITKVNVANTTSFALFKTSAHTITFEAHDEPVDRNSGLKEIRYQLVKDGDSYVEDITDGTWKSCSVSDTITTDENFTGEIYAYAIDQVGNISRPFIQKIERVSGSLVNNAFKEGIVDKTNKVNIVGLSDPDVSVSLAEKNIDEYKESISQDFLASHDLQNIYDISLMKNGNAYTLNEEITVRLVIDEALLNNGSLKLMALQDNGDPQEVAMIIGEGYVEFKTNKLSLYAIVTEKAASTTDVAQTAMNQTASPNTGDTTVVSQYAFALLLSIAGISFLAYRHRIRN